MSEYRTTEGELHAHFGYSSCDCDGQYTGGRDMSLGEWKQIQSDLHSDFEPADSMNDIRFYNWCLDSIQHFFSFEYGATMTFRIDDQGRRVASWDESTEEGYRSEYVIMCEEDCWLDDSWMRDHTAEAAGY